MPPQTRREAVSSVLPRPLAWAATAEPPSLGLERPRAGSISHQASSRPPPLHPRRDALVEVEEAVAVVLPLDRRQAVEVRAVVRPLPRLEIGIDVVLIGEPGDVRAHLAVEVPDPPQVLAGSVAGPRRDVLDREQR